VVEKALSPVTYPTAARGGQTSAEPPVPDNATQLYAIGAPDISFSRHPTDAPTL
jgi:hypothetical protein